MFRLSSLELTGRRILIVEPEEGMAERMACEIQQCGGVTVGQVHDVESALSLVAAQADVDCAMLDIHLLAGAAAPVMSALSEHRIDLVFVSGHDDWFACEQ
jgi:CheY-like chemotaxis protein